MKRTARERLVMLLAPLAVVFGGYAWWFIFFEKPKLQAARQEYEQALAAQASPMDILLRQTKNTQLLREIDALTEQQATLDAQAAEACGRTIEPLRRISAEQEMGALLRRHDVQLLAAEAGVKSGESKLPGALAEAIERLAPKAHEHTGQARLLRLEGRFMDVLAAMQELAQCEASPVIPISLTMAEADLSADDRQWTLLVWM